MMQGFRVCCIWVICGVILLLSGCKSGNTVRKTVFGERSENSAYTLMGEQKRELDTILPTGAIVESINNGTALKVTFDSDIFYAANSNTISETAKSVLRLFANNLINNPETHIQITGHTDNTGRADYNLTLSERRAKSVYDYLCEQGVSSSRMVYSGQGIYEPITNNNTAEGRALNRRVEIRIEAEIPIFVPTITQ